jgi:hypothetical protein
VYRYKSIQIIGNVWKTATWTPPSPARPRQSDNETEGETSELAEIAFPHARRSTKGAIRDGAGDENVVVQIIGQGSIETTAVGATDALRGYWPNRSDK